MSVSRKRTYLMLVQRYKQAYLGRWKLSWRPVIKGAIQGPIMFEQISKEQSVNLVDIIDIL